jgi:hypothetical protein
VDGFISIASVTQTNYYETLEIYIFDEFTPTAQIRLRAQNCSKLCQSSRNIIVSMALNCKREICLSLIRLRVGFFACGNRARTRSGV